MDAVTPLETQAVEQLRVDLEKAAAVAVGEGSAPVQPVVIATWTPTAQRGYRKLLKAWNKVRFALGFTRPPVSRINLCARCAEPLLPLPLPPNENASKISDQQLTVTATQDTIGRPALIAQPTSPEQVALLLSFARRERREISVHSAGAHSSHALVTDSVCIDLSRLRSVTVDPSTKTADVGGGCTIGDVDDACAPHQLALPMGHVFHTGVAGMALNATSGVGYLSRTRGLCVSWLREVTIVLSNGEIRDVSAESDPELFWGIKGAASNFGVVTRMRFALSAIHKEVVAGDIVKFPKGVGPPVWNSGKSRLELATNWVSA